MDDEPTEDTTAETDPNSEIAARLEAAEAKIAELLELNDLTEEDCLEYLLSTKFIELPEVLPIEFDE